MMKSVKVSSVDKLLQVSQGHINMSHQGLERNSVCVDIIAKNMTLNIVVIDEECCISNLTNIMLMNK